MIPSGKERCLLLLLGYVKQRLSYFPEPPERDRSRVVAEDVIERDIVVSLGSTAGMTELGMKAIDSSGSLMPSSVIDRKSTRLNSSH